MVCGYMCMDMWVHVLELLLVTVHGHLGGHVDRQVKFFCEMIISLDQPHSCVGYESVG